MANRKHTAYTEVFYNDQEDGKCAWRGYVHSYAPANAHLEEVERESPTRVAAMQDAKLWSETLLDEKYLTPKTPELEIVAGD